MKNLWRGFLRGWHNHRAETYAKKFERFHLKYTESEKRARQYTRRSKG